MPQQQRRRPMSREEARAREERRQRQLEKEQESRELARGPIDMPFLVLVLLLTGIGLIMLLSASFPSAYYETEGRNPMSYFIRQAIFAAMGIAAMHWVGTRCKCDSFFAAIWGCTGVLTIGYVRSNGKNRGCRNTSTVGVISFDITDEGVKHFFCNFIYTVIIVTVFREISFDFEINCYTILITDWFYFCIFNC